MECLEKIWSTLGVGENGFLNKPELLRLCQHVGVNASEEDISELFDGLKLDEDGRVSFEELVQLFRASKMGVRDEREIEMDDASSVLNCDLASCDPADLSVVPETGSLGVSGDSTSRTSPQSSLSFRSLSTVFTDLDPFRTGLTSWDALCRWWEERGVEDGSVLMETLGYPAPDDVPSVCPSQVNGIANGRSVHKPKSSLKVRSMSAGNQSEMISLASVEKCLEAEVSTATQLIGTKNLTPGHSLTIAALLAYQRYCNLLKSDLDAANKQTDKARKDVLLANARAAALAQELDDQNARIERSEAERVQLLEAEYGEKLRQLRKELDDCRQLVAKENQASEEANVRAEELEEERSRAAEKLAALKEELLVMKESHDELKESLAAKTGETERLIAELKHFQMACEEDQMKALEEADALSKQASELESLREEVARLRAENKRLLDENDVLVSQAQQNAGSRDQRQGYSQWPDIMSGVMVASASTSTSCSSPAESITASPVTSPTKKRIARAKSFAGSGTKSSIRRRGKVARVPSLSQELCLEITTRSPSPSDVEQEANSHSEKETKSVLVQVDGQDISNQSDPKIAGILSRLENVILELHSCSEAEAALAPEAAGAKEETVEEVASNASAASPVSVFVDAQCSTDLSGSELEERLTIADDSVKKIGVLEEARADLTAKLDFLQAEYDDSEDYWQKKMEEERQYYEGHINSLSEKLNSLLTEFQAKLAEYEEASAASASPGQSYREEKAAKANTAEESLQQSTLPTILETDYEIQVMEAEAEAKKWENMWADAEEEKAEIAEEARRAIDTLSRQWMASISTVQSSLLSQIESLTSRVETVANRLPRVHGAAVRWKMRAWEAEGLVHRLETEKLRLKEKQISAVQELPGSPTKELQRLAAKLWQEETKARHLESSLRNEKDHASKIMNEMNRQHNAEVQELQHLLSATRSRLQDMMRKFSSSANLSSVAAGYEYNFAPFAASNGGSGNGAPKQPPGLLAGQGLHEAMLVQNERLSSSMKSLSGGEKISPRRIRGGGIHGSINSPMAASVDDSTGRTWNQQCPPFYYQPPSMPQHLAQPRAYYASFPHPPPQLLNCGPWSLPPPSTAPPSPCRRGHVLGPPPAQLMPGCPSSSSSRSAFYGNASSEAMQQQRRKRPPPAPPGYVHVSHPGDNYI